MSDPTERLPPPPFWRTPYFERAMARPDRRTIDVNDISRAMEAPARTFRQADGRMRFWYYVSDRAKWLRVVTEADGETVHNAFWDRRFG